MIVDTFRACSVRARIGRRTLDALPASVAGPLTRCRHEQVVAARAWRYPRRGVPREARRRWAANSASEFEQARLSGPVSRDLEAKSNSIPSAWYTPQELASHYSFPPGERRERSHANSRITQRRPSPPSTVGGSDAWLSPESLAPVLRQKALQLRANRTSPCTRRIVWKPSTNGIVEIAKAARVSAAAPCIAWVRCREPSSAFSWSS